MPAQRRGRGVLVGQLVGDRVESVTLHQDVVGVAAIEGDSRDAHVPAVDEIASPSRLAVAAETADSYSLALGPTNDLPAEFGDPVAGDERGGDAEESAPSMMSLR
jgi:hypothetical protein